jgi:hypothetical protein
VRSERCVPMPLAVVTVERYEAFDLTRRDALARQVGDVDAPRGGGSQLRTDATPSDNSARVTSTTPDPSTIAWVDVGPYR